MIVTAPDVDIDKEKQRINPDNADYDRVLFTSSIHFPLYFHSDGALNVGSGKPKNGHMFI
jgi:hypothetical protein